VRCMFMDLRKMGCMRIVLWLGGMLSRLGAAARGMDEMGQVNDER